MESKKPFEVGDDFRAFITSLTVPELLSLAKDVGQFPEDKNYRSAINDEIKTRAGSTTVSAECRTIEQVRDWIAWCETFPEFRPGTVAYGALLKLKPIVEEGVSRNEAKEDGEE